MSERFTSEDYGTDYYTEIVDNKKELDMSVDNPSQKLTVSECVDLLNYFNHRVFELEQELLYKQLEINALHEYNSKKENDELDLNIYVDKNGI